MWQIQSDENLSVCLCWTAAFIAFRLPITKWHSTLEAINSDKGQFEISGNDHIKLWIQTWSMNLPMVFDNGRIWETFAYCCGFIRSLRLSELGECPTPCGFDPPLRSKLRSLWWMTLRAKVWLETPCVCPLENGLAKWSSPLLHTVKDDQLWSLLCVLWPTTWITSNLW